MMSKTIFSKLFILTLLFSGETFSLLACSKTHTTDTTVNSEIRAAVTGQVLVGFADPQKAKHTIEDIEALEGVTFERVIFDQPNTKIALFNVPEGHEDAYSTKISKLPNVKYAEPEAIVTTQ